MDITQRAPKQSAASLESESLPVEPAQRVASLQSVPTEPVIASKLPAPGEDGSVSSEAAQPLPPQGNSNGPRYTGQLPESDAYARDGYGSGFDSQNAAPDENASEQAPAYTRRYADATPQSPRGYDRDDEDYADLAGGDFGGRDVYDDSRNTNNALRDRGYGDVADVEPSSRDVYDDGRYADNARGEDVYGDRAGDAYPDRDAYDNDRYAYNDPGDYTYAAAPPTQPLLVRDSQGRLYELLPYNR